MSATLVHLGSRLLRLRMIAQTLTRLVIAGVLLIASEACAAPAQLVLSASKSGVNSSIENKIDPLRHLSAISPFFVPNHKPTPIPSGCELEQATLLVRHSAILGNDDEFEQTMEPFISKIWDLQQHKPEVFPSEGDWAFLKDWKTSIVEENLEVLSVKGANDATEFGRYIRKHYGSLYPDKVEGKKGHAPKHSKNKKNKGAKYKVWTASSDRDIQTAEAYIKGSFPSHQSGPHGHGDGTVVQLIKVPNKAAAWDRSLTPHKACAKFEKNSSLKPANVWLGVYAPKVRARLGDIVPELAKELNDQDILAMQMLCGYESIARDVKAEFCSLFTDDEWLDVEYYFDVRFHYMMGYGNSLSPYLGMPWVKTAAHLLAGKDTGGDHHGHEASINGGKRPPGHDPLPEPKLPPNATHTQLLFTSFTHRESPAFVSTFLNLYNSTESGLPPASQSPSLHFRPPTRAWRTSHIVPFLGFVALEKYSCPAESHGWTDVFSKKHHKKAEYVRAVVNGKQEKMGGCDDGVGEGCEWKKWSRWVAQRTERWANWESVCGKPEE